MKTTRVTPELIESLKQLIESLKKELQRIRQASLKATKEGDFMKVARLTTVAAKLNKSIMDAEADLLAQNK